MLVIVSYDIEDDKTRTRLARELRNFGPRVQKSVFEGDITHEELNVLQTCLSNVQLKSGDSIRLYRLCGECIKKIELFGQGEVTKDRDFYII